MSRRVGAYIQWDASKLSELTDIPKEMIERVGDMTPVMTVIATDDLKPNMIDHLEQGPAWPPKSKETIKRHGDTPLGVGENGGFVPTIQSAWSSKNAVAFTRAPHAHLFSGGTAEHYDQFGQQQNLFSAGATTRGRGKNKGQTLSGGHLSRAESRRRLVSGGFALMHQPPRPFDYIDDDVEERSMRRVAAFITGEPFDGAV
jgi:hypothetical protein